METNGSRKKYGTFNQLLNCVRSTVSGWTQTRLSNIVFSLLDQTCFFVGSDGLIGFWSDNERCEEIQIMWLFPSVRFESIACPSPVPKAMIIDDG